MCTEGIAAAAPDCKTPHLLAARNGLYTITISMSSDAWISSCERILADEKGKCTVYFSFTSTHG